MLNLINIFQCMLNSLIKEIVNIKLDTNELKESDLIDTVSKMSTESILSDKDISKDFIKSLEANHAQTKLHCQLIQKYNEAVNKIGKYYIFDYLIEYAVILVAKGVISYDTLISFNTLLSDNFRSKIIFTQQIKLYPSLIKIFQSLPINEIT